MRGSSVYGVLKLEDSHFNTCAMVEETREFETDSFAHGYHVCWTPVMENNWFVRGKREIQETDMQ